MATRSPSAQGILSHLNPATWRPDIWTTPMAPLEEKKISNRSKTHYLAAISVRGSVIPTIFIPTLVCKVQQYISDPNDVLKEQQ